MNEEEQKLRKKFEIIRLFEEGFSQSEIAEKTSTSKSTVQYTLAKFHKNNTMLRIKGSGRKRSLNNDDRKFLIDKLKENPMVSAQKLSNKLVEEREKVASSRTIQRELKYEGFMSAVPRKLPALSKKI
jgi:transposase